MNTIEDRTKEMTKETRFEEIKKIFEEVLISLKKERQKDFRSKNEGRSADWSKEKICIRWISLELLENHNRINISMSYTHSYYSYNGHGDTISSPWVCGDTSEFEWLLGKLKGMVENFSVIDNEYLFAPAISVNLDAYVRNIQNIGKVIVKNNSYEEYVLSIQKFYNDVMNDRMGLKDINYFRFSSILSGLCLYTDTLNSCKRIIEFISKLNSISFTNRIGGYTFRHKMKMFLEGVCQDIKRKKKSPNGFELNLNEEEQELFNFTGEYCIAEGDEYYGKQYYTCSAECGNEVALEKLGKKRKKKKAFASYKDDNVSLEAHNADLQRYVKFVVKNENEAAYHKMVTFLTDIIINGFTPDYKLDFKSSIKNYLEIEDIGNKQIKNSMSQFWSNSAKYPTIYNDILEYVKAATSKGGDEYWYDDGMAEDEYTHPGGYASAALVLADPSGKYLEEALGEFIESVDIEYCSWPYQVGKAFYKKWGLTEESLPGIALCLASEFISDKDAKALSENEELLNYMRKNNMHMGIMD